MSKDLPRRLGRGLSALLSVPELPADEPQAAPTPTNPAAEAPLPAPQTPATTAKVGQLRPNAYQPRREMQPDQLKALADSIRQSGILQPIVVRTAQDGVHEIIAGERRWRAAQMAGLAEVPIVIREATDEQMLELALVENIFREDLNAIERSLAYRRYCDQFSLSADQVAQRLGEDRTTVTNYLRLLELPTEVKDWVAAGRLSMGHARCLLGLRSPAELLQVAQQAMDEELSVRALEALVREKVAARAAASKPPAATAEAKRPQIRSLEQAFAQALGTKVQINESKRKGSGKIVIHYFNLDDFDRVLEKLGVQPE